MHLTLEDHQHLTAADGYCELKMYLDADAELEQITGKRRHLPEVLGISLKIYDGMMHVMAKNLVEYDTDNVQWWIALANATRWTENLEAAKLTLLEGLKKHPREAQVHYDLACYECQLGDLKLAKNCLEHAIKIDKNCRITALADEDFRPLWGWLKSNI